MTDKQESKQDKSQRDVKNLKKRSGGTWKPGQSGNLKGRPPLRHCLTERIRDALNSTTFQGKPLPDGKTAADVITERLIGAAINGEPFALKEILLRHAPIDQEDKNDKPAIDWSAIDNESDTPPRQRDATDSKGPEPVPDGGQA